jgi:hypothetical protein
VIKGQATSVQANPYRYQRITERRLKLAITAGANPIKNADQIVELCSSHGMMASSLFM